MIPDPVDTSGPLAVAPPDPPDPHQLVRTLHRLLQARGAHGLRADREGWVAVDDVVVAASTELCLEVRSEQVLKVGHRLQRFEVRGTFIRMHQRARLPAVPDILFHATTSAGVQRAVDLDLLGAPASRRLVMSASEDQAWRAAHRLDGEPRVLVVDAVRARRAGVRFSRTRSHDLFTATPIPARHLLNLRPGYAEQWSAGGIPARRDPDGRIRFALIRVTRRSGTTWEVAKGKLEPGESPEDAAVREVQEEMGVDVDFRLLRHVGDVRYGFLAPGPEPRLKTIFLYLMEPVGELGAFDPASAEGIGDVQWFTADEAVAAVTHSSLQPLMWRARDLVARYGLAPDAVHPDATVGD
ncbi:MAG: NUDIX domain-containing protein [Alphaproteobacteria bacterium]|nr:NUDIX domain-containing protein [Alphaproteobacteria bacterium]